VSRTRDAAAQRAQEAYDSLYSRMSRQQQHEEDHHHRVSAEHGWEGFGSLECGRNWAHNLGCHPVLSMCHRVPTACQQQILATLGLTSCGMCLCSFLQDPRSFVGKAVDSVLGKSHASASDRVADLADSFHLPRRHHHHEDFEVSLESLALHA
jgi:hypothetical protein